VKKKNGFFLKCEILGQSSITPNEKTNEKCEIFFDSGFLTFEEQRSEEDNDTILETLITLERDFFLVYKTEMSLEFRFSLEYLTKANDPCIETSVIPAFSQEKSKKILLDFKPSSCRVFISHENHEITQKIGKISVFLHRLVYLPHDYNKKDYSNVNLFDPEGKFQENGHEFQLQVGFEIENQTFRSGNFNKFGLFEEILEKHDFLYSDPGVFLKISLFLAKMKDAANMVHKTPFDKSLELELASTEIPLSLLFSLKNNAKKGFFSIELPKKNSGIGKDLIWEFINSFNTERIFLLFGLENVEMEWSDLKLRVKELKMEKGVEKCRYLGVKIKVMQMSGEVMSSVSEFESELIEVNQEEAGKEEEKNKGEKKEEKETEGK